MVWVSQGQTLLHMDSSLMTDLPLGYESTFVPGKAKRGTQSSVGANFQLSWLRKNHFRGRGRGHKGPSWPRNCERFGHRSSRRLVLERETEYGGRVWKNTAENMLNKHCAWIVLNVNGSWSFLIFFPLQSRKTLQNNLICNLKLCDCKLSEKPN